MKNLYYLFLILFSYSSSSSFLEWEWQHYTSPPSLKTQSQDYVLLRWDQKNEFTKKVFSFNSHIQSEYSLDRSNFFYFNIPELYLSYQYELKHEILFINSIEINLGRKTKVWSFANDYWEMGLWDSLNLWNPLHPQKNGLVGSFLSLKADKWAIDLLIAGLHLPDTGPQMLEKEGRIYSNSRWFGHLLPDQVGLKNAMDIKYEREDPFLFDFLFQQSYLFSFKTWSKTSNAYYWMTWSFADKPVNHLFVVLNNTNLFFIEPISSHIRQIITVLPVRQRVLSAEWGFDYNKISTVFSVGNTKMKEESISPAGWKFLRARENFTYFSALIRYNFSDNSLVQVAYLDSWFQKYQFTEHQKTINTASPSVLVRYKVLQGFSVDWETAFLSSDGLKREVSLNYRYSFLNEGAWLYVNGLYHFSPGLYASVSIDILGAKKSEEYFLNRFRHNDYFSLRLGYAF